jgi:hypothetical protein
VTDTTKRLTQFTFTVSTDTFTLLEALAYGREQMPGALIRDLIDGLIDQEIGKPKAFASYGPEVHEALARYVADDRWVTREEYDLDRAASLLARE